MVSKTFCNETQRIIARCKLELASWCRHHAVSLLVPLFLQLNVGMLFEELEHAIAVNYFCMRCCVVRDTRLHPEQKIVARPCEKAEKAARRDNAKRKLDLDTVMLAEADEFTPLKKAKHSFFGDNLRQQYRSSGLRLQQSVALACGGARVKTVKGKGRGLIFDAKKTVKPGEPVCRTTEWRIMTKQAYDALESFPAGYGFHYLNDTVLVPRALALKDLKDIAFIFNTAKSYEQANVIYEITQHGVMFSFEM